MAYGGLPSVVPPWAVVGLRAVTQAIGTVAEPLPRGPGGPALADPGPDAA
ncbi:hypothetical protein WEB32_33200 [Streptomyces netropsis]